MKSKTKKKPAAKKRAKKSAASAPAVRVSSVVMKVYPHIVQVEVNGAENPHLRSPKITPAEVQTYRGQLATHYGLNSQDAVKIEHLDARGNPRAIL